MRANFGIAQRGGVVDRRSTGKVQSWIGRQLAAPHVIVMGASTYRVPAPIAAAGDDPMTGLPKIVFSGS